MGPFFHIVALVYVMMAGKPTVDEPFTVNHKMTFSDETKCNDFLKSDEFAHQRSVLAKVFQDRIDEMAELDDAKPEADAPSGRPGVAVTASCVEDGRT
jgi:hypothetical protein